MIDPLLPVPWIRPALPPDENDPARRPATAPANYLTTKTLEEKLTSNRNKKAEGELSNCTHILSLIPSMRGIGFGVDMGGYSVELLLSVVDLLLMYSSLVGRQKVL